MSSRLGRVCEVQHENFSQKYNFLNQECLIKALSIIIRIKVKARTQTLTMESMESMVLMVQQFQTQKDL
jgi:hypothetical protein